MNGDGYPGNTAPGARFRSTDEVCVELGEQIRRARLAADISQEVLAARANVAVTVIRKLEHGRGASLTSLVKIARALDVVDSWLLNLAPDPGVSPLEVLRARGLLRERKRATRRRRDDVVPEST